MLRKDGLSEDVVVEYGEVNSEKADADAGGTSCSMASTETDVQLEVIARLFQ